MKVCGCWWQQLVVRETKSDEHGEISPISIPTYYTVRIARVLRIPSLCSVESG